MHTSTLFQKFPHIVHAFLTRSEVPEDAGIQSNNIITLEQTHSSKVGVSKMAKKFYPEIDGLIMKEKGVIGIRTADCLPVFFYDPKTVIWGAVHAGRKGLMNDILTNALAILKNEGASIRSTLAIIGPHIRACCYPTDLSEIARLQLIKGGISEKNIDISRICTYMDDRFLSYRREKILPGNRVPNAIIGVRN